MLPCSQCSQEVSLRTALLTQDFYAQPLAFCSATCQDRWMDGWITSSHLRSTALRPELGDNDRIPAILGGYAGLRVCNVVASVF